MRLKMTRILLLCGCQGRKSTACWSSLVEAPAWVVMMVTRLRGSGSRCLIITYHGHSWMIRPLTSWVGEGGGDRGSNGGWCMCTRPATAVALLISCLAWLPTTMSVSPPVVCSYPRTLVLPLAKPCRSMAPSCLSNVPVAAAAAATAAVAAAPRRVDDVSPRDTTVALGAKQDVRLYLCDWGFNTEAHRAAGEANARIRVIGPADPMAILARSCPPVMGAGDGR